LQAVSCPFQQNGLKNCPAVWILVTDDRGLYKVPDIDTIDLKDLSQND